MTNTRTPVVFIHGLWLHATSWTPWLELFREAGYEPVAPGWPGIPDTVEQARANPGSIAGHGIEDVTRHYASFINGLSQRPVLVGHSFGGMIAEKLLGEDYGAAANFSLHSADKVQTRNDERGPLLLVMGGQDHTVPEAITKSTLKQYRHSGAVTDLEEFSDRGHSLTIDAGWPVVAGLALTWLSKQGL